MKYYRVIVKPEVDVDGPRSFWMRVVSETESVVVGWELTSDGERTHRQHIISRELATFLPADMNKTYGTMERL